MAPELLQRKRLPHFAPVIRHNAPIVLFVTMAIRPRVNALANDVAHAAFQDALAKADAWRAFLYVMMPDHIHAFVVPRTWPSFPIARWAEFLKRNVTQSLGGRTSSCAAQWHWQTGCWDTQMRDMAHLEEKTAYVRMNPVRAGLCATPEEWKWRGEGEWVEWL